MSEAANELSLVLYDLTNEPGGTREFSPHCMKTIIDLKIIGVPYTRERLSFIQIRNDLATKLNSPDITVPTITARELASTHLTDSWLIAEWLNENGGPNANKIFGPNQEEGRRIAALVNEYAKTVLSAGSLAMLSMPSICESLDQASQDYFIKDKIGQARFDSFISLTQEQKEEKVAHAIKHLGLFETMLAAGKSASKWLAGGEDPTHADACLFGFYVFSRGAGEHCKAIWHSDQTPSKVKQWVDDMLAWLGEDLVKDFVPLP